MMEEIVELNEEIRMKARWINNRVKLLNKYGSETTSLSPKMKKIVGNFMLRIKQHYPHKSYKDLMTRKGLGTYYGEGENKAIPLKMDKGETIALEMNKGEPIALTSYEKEALDLEGKH